MKILQVTWLDAGHLNGWIDVDTLVEWAEDSENFTIKTAGYLVAEHDDWIVVTAHISLAHGQHHTPMRIMKKCILKTEVLYDEDTQDVGVRTKRPQGDGAES